MPDQTSKLPLISSVAIIALALGFVAGYLSRGLRETPVTPVRGETPSGGTPAPVTEPPPAVAAPAAPPATMMGDSIVWTKLENGCTVEQSGTAYHIQGTTDKDGYNHWNGVQTVDEYPEGDFTVSVDIKVPLFAGPGGNPLVYLRAAGAGADSDTNAIGLYLVPSIGYRVQAWTNPQIQSTWRGRFGNEATTFHRIILQYEVATQTATGWVDNSRIGAIKAPFNGKFRIQLAANTDKAGMDIDLYYDHFKYTPGLAGPPSPAPTSRAGPVAPALP